MKKATIVFSLTVLALLAVAQAPYPLIITGLETKDLQGNSKDIFKRGEIVLIETEIKVAPAYYYYFVGSIDYLEIITMWYGNSMMGLLMTRTSITSVAETKTFGGGVGIRFTDPIGNYEIEVYVWNGFPSEKGAQWAPLAESRAKTITVTG